MSLRIIASFGELKFVISEERSKNLFAMPRLYIQHSIHLDQIIDLNADQAHYLMNVMRLQNGDVVHIFNGVDGEWESQLERVSKSKGLLIPKTQLREQHSLPQRLLVFAPIKHDRLHFMLEKATELGVTHLQPIITDHCQIHKINLDKLQKTTIEAAEQSERLSIPEISPLIPLKNFIAHFPKDFVMGACLERMLDSVTPQSFCEQHRGKSLGFIVGPEGGFSDTEKKLLQTHTQPLSLGDLILRAETAALKVLSIAC